MKIFTTPMCQEVVRLAGVPGFVVKEDNNFEGADLAIVLSETELNIPAIKIKLNTFKQIYESINLISNTLGTEKLDLKGYIADSSTDINPQSEVLDKRKKIKVKAYSNFIRDIIEDMGFTLVENEPDFLVFPDYIKEVVGDDITQEIDLMKNRSIEIPSHKNAPINPIKRAQMRYHILESRLCMKP